MVSGSPTIRSTQKLTSAALDLIIGARVGTHKVVSAVLLAYAFS